jgi:RNA polymerase sigma factor (sigma-70 family)
MQSLLTKARNGDEKAEKELFQHLLVRFRSFATRAIGGEEADDVAQDACMAVLRKYKTATFSKGFAPWAYGVLKMEIRSHIHVRKRKPRTLTRDFETGHSAVQSTSQPDYDLKRRLIDCLRQITKHNRTYARVLNFVHQGYGRKEVCERLQIKPNNFYVILSRGRRLMRTCLRGGSI